MQKSVQKPATQTMNGRQWGLLIILSILWGGSFFFSKVALEELRPFTLVFGRVALAALTLWLVLLATGVKMPTDLKIWRGFFVMGLLNNFIPFSLIFWGQTHIPSGLASILNATTPVWAIVLAHFFTDDEKMKGNRLGGVFLGVVGVTVMIGFDVFEGMSGIVVLAQLAVVGATISYAFAGIFGKRFAGVPPMVTATGQVIASSVMMLPVFLLVDRPWQSVFPGWITWGALFGLAILSTAVAYIIFFNLLQTAGATNLLLVTLLIPVSALLLGILILGESIVATDFVGMGVIALGLVVLDGRLLSFGRGKSEL